MRDAERVVLAVAVEPDERDIGASGRCQRNRVHRVAGRTDEFQPRLGCQDGAQHVTEEAIGLHHEYANAVLCLLHISLCIYRRA